MFLKHTDSRGVGFLSPCRVMAETTDFVTVMHELCKNRPSFMVFKRNGSDTELRPARKAFKWTLVTIPFGYTSILSD